MNVTPAAHKYCKLDLSSNRLGFTIEKALGKSEDILGTIPTAAEMQAELNSIKEDSEEALKEIKTDGIKDKMSSTEPPKELKTPKT